MRARESIAAGLVAATILAAGCSSVALDDLLEVTSGGGPVQLDRETVISGLRQALEIGSDRTVERTAVIDGFLANELIRIVIPSDMEPMTKTLRKLGLGRQVDDLELNMNRAAEEAASGAREILWEEIRDLTFPDAMAILEGGKTAATDLLEERTSADIRDKFHPIILRKMEEVGLARLYADLAERYNRLPFVSGDAVDLDAYVTDQALAGIFTILGQEEARIREDPVARTTELLKQVFG
ncbi:MAG: DUF4197 domain-containing protein [bacterium]|nr:DUF4197 domain-containing protein [bacterium]